MNNQIELCPLFELFQLLHLIAQEFEFRFFDVPVCLSNKKLMLVCLMLTVGSLTTQ